MVTGTHRTGAVILTAALLAACASADLTPDDEKVVTSGDVVDRGTLPLTAAEIEIYLTDSTLSHVGAERLWHVYVGRNGELVGQSRTKDGAVERNRGQWSIRGGGPSGASICRQWEMDWGGGESGCATVYRFGTEFVFVPEGASGSSGDDIRRTRTPGDTYNII